MKVIKLCLVFLLLALVGCEGPKGDTGSPGAQGSQGDTGTQGDQGTKGDPGENAQSETYTGTIPANEIVSLGSGAISSNSVVTVWYAFPGTPNVWSELGHPDSALANPYCAVDDNLSAVYFFNTQSTWLYKIIVITPSLAPQLSAKERFNYFEF